DVEVHDVFAAAKLCVKRDGWLVAVVSLDVDHPGPAARGDCAKMSNKRGRYALATERVVSRKVVDVDLAALLLKLIKLVCNQPTNHSPFTQGNERNNALFRKHLLYVGIARWSGGVVFSVLERLGEHSVQRVEVRDVARAKAVDSESHRRRLVL